MRPRTRVDLEKQLQALGTNSSVFQLRPAVGYPCESFWKCRGSDLVSHVPTLYFLQGLVPADESAGFRFQRWRGRNNSRFSLCFPRLDFLAWLLCPALVVPWGRV